MWNKICTKKLHYESVLDDQREMPAWVDGVLKKTLHLSPYKRYEELTDFVYDLHTQNKVFLNKTSLPLLSALQSFSGKVLHLS